MDRRGFFGRAFGGLGVALVEPFRPVSPFVAAIDTGFTRLIRAIDDLVTALAGRSWLASRYARRYLRQRGT